MHIKKAYVQSVDAVTQQAETDQESGLSQKEAQRRLREYGKNQLPSGARDSYITIFFRQFRDPLIYILLCAAFLILAIGHPYDAFIISIVLIFNAVVGTLLEGRAQNVLEELRRVAAGTCSVVRDGQMREIKVQELVVGDLLVLKKGDQVPADGRIVFYEHLLVDESVLTGESTQVEKQKEPLSEDTRVFDQTNMVFKGTAIVEGEAYVVVTATGLDTQLGSMHKTIAEVETEMPLKKSLDRLSYGILYALAGMVVVLFTIGVLWGKDWYPLFLTLTTLFIAVIPEGLPVVFTVVLARGTYRMLKQQVLVKRLQAVEGLGRVSILIIDKTGTLTRNEMEVTRVYTDTMYHIEGESYHHEGTVTQGNQEVTASVASEDLELLAHAVLLLNDSDVEQASNRDRYVVHGDPTEAAMAIFSRRLGYTPEELGYTQIHELPYSDEHHMHFGVYRENSNTHIFIAGAPEVLFKQARSVPDEMRNALDTMVEDGLRVIGIGYYDPNDGVDDWDQYFRDTVLGDIRMLGLCGMRDPVRTEVAGMVKKARDAGYQVIMATGDHQKTGAYVARETNILYNDYEIATGQELDAVLEDQQRWNRTKAFARVTPDDKLKLLQAYHDQGHMVAMTGDGVNDVPALAGADVSIAMGQSGTDIAQKAADLVLLNDSFASIVRAIEEARHIFYTLRRVVLYFFSTNCAEVMMIFFALMLNMKLPVYPIQLLWLNFVSDGFLDVGLSFEPHEEGLLNQKWLERAQRSGLFDMRLVWTIVYMAIPMAIASLVAFKLYADLDKARTMSLVTLTMFQWFNAWNCRSETKSLLQLSPISNPWLILATLLVVSIQSAILYVPFFQAMFHTVAISVSDWGIAALMACFIIFYDELRKLYVRRYLR